MVLKLSETVSWLFFLQKIPVATKSRFNWPKIWTMLSGELNFSCLDESSFVSAGTWGGFGDWESAPDEIMASTE